MLTKQQIEWAGQHLADALELQPNAAGFYSTIYGPKTMAGLGRLLEGIIETTKEIVSESGE